MGDSAHAAESTTASTAPDAGPAELPPIPARRVISPAPEDYENRPPLANLLWPLFWCGVALVIGWCLWGTWPPFDGHH